MLPENFDELSIPEKIKASLDTGNWMIRISNQGIAYGGFEWSPLGEWTHTHDWNNHHSCGGGLHGSAPEAFGYLSKYDNPRLEFCVTKGERIIIGGDKIKVPSAMILCFDDDAIDCLPDNLTVGGSLDLSHTQITHLPDNITYKVIK